MFRRHPSTAFRIINLFRLENSRTERTRSSLLRIGFYHRNLCRKTTCEPRSLCPRARVPKAGLVWGPFLRSFLGNPSLLSMVRHVIHPDHHSQKTLSVVQRPPKEGEEVIISGTWPNAGGCGQGSRNYPISWPSFLIAHYLMMDIVQHSRHLARRPFFMRTRFAAEKE